jgi:hypothetical protein
MERDAIENTQPQAQPLRNVLPRRGYIHGGQITEQANKSGIAENLDLSIGGPLDGPLEKIKAKKNNGLDTQSV